PFVPAWHVHDDDHTADLGVAGRARVIGLALVAVVPLKRNGFRNQTWIRHAILAFLRFRCRTIATRKVADRPSTFAAEPTSWVEGESPCRHPKPVSSTCSAPWSTGAPAWRASPRRF